MRWTWLLVVAACTGPGEPPGFDTFAFPDSGVPQPICDTVLLPEWPVAGAVGVHLDVTPELRVRDDVRDVRVRLRPNGVGELAGAPVVHRSTGWRLFSFVPDAPLVAGVSYTLAATGSADCDAGLEVSFTTAAPYARTGPVSGSWWLDGNQPSGVGADILQRLFPKMGDGYGLAPRIDLDEDWLRLGTVLRSGGVPDNPGDPTNEVAVDWDDGFAGAAVDWVVEDPVAPLVLRGAVVRGHVEPGTVRLVGVRVSGVADLRGWPADRLAEACAMADEQGIACVPCDDGAVACIPIDARGMSGTRR